MYVNHFAVYIHRSLQWYATILTDFNNHAESIKLQTDHCTWISATASDASDIPHSYFFYHSCRQDSSSIQCPSMSNKGCDYTQLVGYC